MNSQDVQCWDINKCYTACMYDPYVEWMEINYNDTFDYNDTWMRLITACYFEHI
jgi:hypothetical protein